jgi:hypothetical protein
MNSLTRTLIGTAALMTFTAGSAWAAEPQSLQKEGTGEVVITSGNSATITNDPGEYGLVITKSNYGKLVKGRPSSRLIGDADFSFVSSGTVTGGAPRFSIPIDTNGDGSEDGYAFLDVNGCNGSTLVSTESATCKVYYTTEVFANWDAFVAAHPTYRVIGFPFIIADQAGRYVITNIDVK